MGIRYQRYHCTKAVSLVVLGDGVEQKELITIDISKIQIEVQPSFLSFTQDTTAGRRSFKSFNKLVEVMTDADDCL